MRLEQEAEQLKERLAKDGFKEYTLERHDLEALLATSFASGLGSRVAEKRL